MGEGEPRMSLHGFTTADGMHVTGGTGDVASYCLGCDRPSRACRGTRRCNRLHTSQVVCIVELIPPGASGTNGVESGAAGAPGGVVTERTYRVSQHVRRSDYAQANTSAVLEAVRNGHGRAKDIEKATGPTIASTTRTTRTKPSGSATTRRRSRGSKVRMRGSPPTAPSPNTSSAGRATGRSSRSRRRTRTSRAR